MYGSSPQSCFFLEVYSFSAVVCKLDLTYFKPMFHFYTPIKDFLTFLEGMKIDDWCEMGLHVRRKQNKVTGRKQKVSSR